MKVLLQLFTALEQLASPVGIQAELHHTTGTDQLNSAEAIAPTALSVIAVEVSTFNS